MDRSWYFVVLGPPRRTGARDLHGYNKLSYALSGLKNRYGKEASACTLMAVKLDGSHVFQVAGPTMQVTSTGAIHVVGAKTWKEAENLIGVPTRKIDNYSSPSFGKVFVLAVVGDGCEDTEVLEEDRLI